MENRKFGNAMQNLTSTYKVYLNVSAFLPKHPLRSLFCFFFLAACSLFLRNNHQLVYIKLRFSNVFRRQRSRTSGENLHKTFQWRSKKVVVHQPLGPCDMCLITLFVGRFLGSRIQCPVSHLIPLNLKSSWEVIWTETLGFS